MSKYYLVAVTIILVGCGTYAGTEGIYYFPKGLPEGTIENAPDVITVIPKELTKGLSGLMSSCLGPYAAFVPTIIGALGIVSSMFITKRKKG